MTVSRMLARAKLIDLPLWLMLGLVTVLALWRLGDFSGIRFVTSDDADYGVHRYEGLEGDGPLTLALAVAQHQGRVIQLGQIPLAAFAASLSSDAAYDVINLGAFVSAIGLLAIALWRTVSKEFALLFLLGFWAWCPQLWHHMPPTAYPVFPWVPLSLFAVSILVLERYFRRGHIGWLIGFGALLVLAMFSYEFFFLMFPLLAAAAAVRFAAACAAPRRQTANVLGVTAFSCLAIFATYYGWKVMFPLNYGGAEARVFDPGAIAHVVWTFSKGAFPFEHVASPYEIFYRDVAGEKLRVIAPYSMADILGSASPLGWLMAVCTASGFAALAVRASGATRPGRLATVAALGVVSAVLSVVLYGLTAKYVTWVAQGHVAYLGSRYAYIGWIIALCALAVLASGVARTTLSRVLVLGPLAGVIMAGSLVADYLNPRVTATMKIHNAKWQAVRAVSSCPPLYAALREGVVEAPSLWDSVWYAAPRRDDYWQRYTARVLGQPLAVVRKDPAAPWVLGYEAALQGDLVGAFAGRRTAAGAVQEVRVLTPRDNAAQAMFIDAGRDRVGLLTWRTGSVGCGSYMVNVIMGTDIDLDSISLWVPPTAPLASSARASWR